MSDDWLFAMNIIHVAQEKHIFKDHNELFQRRAFTWTPAQEKEGRAFGGFPSFEVPKHNNFYTILSIFQQQAKPWQNSAKTSPTFVHQIGEVRPGGPCHQVVFLMCRTAWRLSKRSDFVG